MRSVEIQLKEAIVIGTLEQSDGDRDRSELGLCTIVEETIIV